MPAPSASPPAPPVAVESPPLPPKPDPPPPAPPVAVASPPFPAVAEFAVTVLDSIVIAPAL